MVQTVRPLSLSRAAIRAFSPPGVTITREPSTSRHSLIAQVMFCPWKRSSTSTAQTFLARVGLQADHAAVGVHVVELAFGVGAAGPCSRVGARPRPAILGLP